MKEPGLDGRHRDQAAPKKGEIQQKRGDTLNKNLPKPISQFRSDTKLETMRRATGQTSVEKVRLVAAKISTAEYSASLIRCMFVVKDEGSPCVGLSPRHRRL